MKAVNVDEVLKILHKYGKYIFVTDYKKYSDMVDDIANLKALKQEPKTGHWIKKDGFDGDVYYDCSECGESWTTVEGTPWQNGMNYCPNCGARMESEEV